MMNPLGEKRCCRSSGQLHLILGPMFAGKTSELLKRMRLYKLSNRKCMIIRYAKDTRYTDGEIITTHDGFYTEAVQVLKLMTLCHQVKDVDVIGIDEGQFFPDIEEFCQEQVENGKILIVNGLDATFKRTAFENMLNLVPLSHSVVKLSAICMSCGSKAPFTKRIGEETEIELIGGIDKYMAVCRECYKIPRPEKSSPFKRLETCNSKKFKVNDCKRKVLAEM